jgi:hypothetical protein
LQPSSARADQRPGRRQLAGLTSGGEDAEDRMTLVREHTQNSGMGERLIVRMSMDRQH